MGKEDEKRVVVKAEFPIEKRMEIDGKELMIENNINRINKKYGIIKSSERYVEEKGRIYYELEAIYLDKGKIKKSINRIDVTEIVDDIKEAQNIRVVGMIFDSKGKVLYLSPEFDRNVKEWSKKEKLERGQYRLSNEIVGNYNITSYIRGNERELMKNIIKEVDKGNILVNSVNVPPDKFEELQCKNKNMTHVINVYMKVGDNIMQISVNLSRISNKKWDEIKFYNSNSKIREIGFGWNFNLEKVIADIAKKRYKYLSLGVERVLGKLLTQGEKMEIGETEYYQKYGEELKEFDHYEKEGINEILNKKEEMEIGNVEVKKERKVVNEINIEENREEEIRVMSDVGEEINKVDRDIEMLIDRNEIDNIREIKKIKGDSKIIIKDEKKLENKNEIKNILISMESKEISYEEMLNEIKVKGKVIEVNKSKESEKEEIIDMIINDVFSDKTIRINKNSIKEEKDLVVVENLIDNYLKENLKENQEVNPQSLPEKKEIIKFKNLFRKNALINGIDVELEKINKINEKVKDVRIVIKIYNKLEECTSIKEVFFS